MKLGENNTEQNDTQRYAIKHIYIEFNDTQCYDTEQNNNRNYAIQHFDTKHDET